MRLHYTVEPHLSGLFSYPDTCLGTIYEYIYRKCLTYPDSHLGNGGVRISEAPLYMYTSLKKCSIIKLLAVLLICFKYLQKLSERGCFLCHSMYLMYQICILLTAENIPVVNMNSWTHIMKCSHMLLAIYSDIRRNMPEENIPQVISNLWITTA